VILAGGETVTMQLAECGSQLSNKLWLREIRKLTESGHQTYMREHYGLDRLIEYGTEPIPDAISVVNPAWRKLDSVRSAPKLESAIGCPAQFGALALSEDPNESQIQGFQQPKGQLQEEIQALDLEIDKLKQLRRKTPHHIPVNSLPEEDRFTRLRTERKHFVDTLKMIAYRAESSMASLLREYLDRGENDARALLRQIFQTEADLTPDLAANTLNIKKILRRRSTAPSSKTCGSHPARILSTRSKPYRRQSAHPPFAPHRRPFDCRGNRLAKSPLPPNYQESRNS
jgi:hypothetical protein